LLVSPPSPVLVESATNVVVVVDEVLDEVDEDVEAEEVEELDEVVEEDELDDAPASLVSAGLEQSGSAGQSVKPSVSLSTESKHSGKMPEEELDEVDALDDVVDELEDDAPEPDSVVSAGLEQSGSAGQSVKPSVSLSTESKHSGKMPDEDELEEAGVELDEDDAGVELEEEAPEPDSVVSAGLEQSGSAGQSVKPSVSLSTESKHSGKMPEEELDEVAAELDEDDAGVELEELDAGVLLEEDVVAELEDELLPGPDSQFTGTPLPSPEPRSQ
jgi:hypothetical protein